MIAFVRSPVLTAHSAQPLAAALQEQETCPLPTAAAAAYQRVYKAAHPPSPLHHRFLAVGVGAFNRLAGLSCLFAAAAFIGLLAAVFRRIFLNSTWLFHSYVEMMNVSAILLAGFCFGLYCWQALVEKELRARIGMVRFRGRWVVTELSTYITTRRVPDFVHEKVRSLEERVPDVRFFVHRFVQNERDLDPLLEACFGEERYFLCAWDGNADISAEVRRFA